MTPYLDDLLSLAIAPLKGPDWGMAGLVLNACRHDHLSLMLEHPYTTLVENGVDANIHASFHPLKNGGVLLLKDNTAIIARMDNPLKPWKGSQPWFVATAAWRVTELPDFLDFAQTLLACDTAFKGTANFLYTDYVWPAWQETFTMHPANFKTVSTLIEATLTILNQDQHPIIVNGNAFHEKPQLTCNHPDTPTNDALEKILNALVDDTQKYAQKVRRYTQFGTRKLQTTSTDIMTYHPNGRPRSAHDTLDALTKVSEILNAQTT